MLQQIRGYRQVKDLTIKNAQVAADADIETSKLEDGADFLKRDGSVILTGDLDLNSNNITNLANPVNNQDAVTKSYTEATYLQPVAIVRRDTTNEIPDGSRTTFHLAHTPVTNSEEIFLNGLLMDAGAQTDYTINNNEITFNIPPQTSDRLRVNYIASS